jgi:transcriptional regulator with XRE-family HTH domain
MEKVAAICEVDRTQTWRWERGEGGPRARQLLKLLQHYRDDAHYLVNGDPGEEALFDFLETPLGRVIEEDDQLLRELSRYQGEDELTVSQYHKIALNLLKRPTRKT